MVLVVAGCGGSAKEAISDQLGALPPVAARVCVVRPSKEHAEATTEIRDNDRLVGATRGETFVCWLTAPGEHQISAVSSRVTLDVTDTGPVLLAARAGRHYWLHQAVAELQVGPRLHTHLDWVDEPTAAEMIGSCRERVLVSVPGYDQRTDVVAVAPRR